MHDAAKHFIDSVSVLDNDFGLEYETSDIFMYDVESQFVYVFSIDFDADADVPSSVEVRPGFR